MDLADEVKELGNQVEQSTKSILDALKSECETYDSLTGRLTQIKRDFLWSGNFTCAYLVDFMAKVVEEEKGNSKISNCL